MKRYLIIAATVFLIGISAKSQNNLKLDDFGRIVLNTYLPEKMDLPVEARKLLVTKLDQVSSNYGIGASSANPRFIITASINVGTKDIIAGPPQMIAQNLDVTVFIGDALDNKIFSYTTLSLKGVGTNENKAFINALKKINPKNENLEAFIEEGKSSIVKYFNTQCDFTINEAITLKEQGRYEEAIYKLSLVPEVCQDCYFKCLDTSLNVYQEKIDKDGQVKFQKAKMIWATRASIQAAEEAVEVISQIDPLASCQPEVEQFIKSVDAKLRADEKARWEFKIKQYDDQIAKEKELIRIAEEKSIRDDTFREKQAVRNLELDKIRVNAYREVAAEYARNQPKTVSYNNIYWR
ncbi:hypothetical protein [Flagellimonas marinaquae]|uniref:hypothetical protein n=1 Tax=Flagellimonas marinaquae TaxID=254955 RepID=UPI000F8F5CEB|nr:hypothetical protein [Allomuricauda aquimarina]